MFGFATGIASAERFAVSVSDVTTPDFGIDPIMAEGLSDMDMDDTDDVLPMPPGPSGFHAVTFAANCAERTMAPSFMLETKGTGIAPDVSGANPEVVRQVEQGWGLIADDRDMADAVAAGMRSGRDIIIYVNGQGNRLKDCEASIVAIAVRTGAHCIGIYNPTVAAAMPKLSALVFDTVKSALLKVKLIATRSQDRLTAVVSALDAWAGSPMNMRGASVDVIAHSQGAIPASNVGSRLKTIPNVGLTTVGGATWTIGGKWESENHHVFLLDFVGLLGRTMAGLVDPDTHFHWSWKGPLAHPVMNYLRCMDDDLGVANDGEPISVTRDQTLSA
jgi:hypothetical protein